MSLRQFIHNLFNKDRARIIQQENERLKMKLRALEKLKRELEKNQIKKK